MKEMLKVTFAQVFDQDGKIKACGREKCKELISLAFKYRPDKPKNFFGDVTTGYMNIENLLALRDEIS